jgi:quercetin dioxygenase-like cupin family protein
MDIKKSDNVTKSIIAQAAKLSELVGYQAGSIVSKEIIRTEKGTITLFAFDKGQGLSEHTAPFDALVYVFDGKTEISISGKPLNVKTGETIIMPANKPHALKAIDRFKMLLVMIKS